MKINLHFPNNLLFLLFVLSFNSTFSQESFLITKDGNELKVDGSKVKLLEFHDKFEYQEINSGKKNKISLNQIKTAVLGNYHVETFTIDNKPQECFIIAENNEKKLVGFNKVKNTTSTMSSGLTEFYYYYVLDKSNNLIDKMKFASDDYGGNSKERDIAENIVRKYFSNCPELMGRLNANDTKVMDLQNASKMAQKFAQQYEQANSKMALTFGNPTYSKCNDATSPIETIVSGDNNVISSQYDGTYKFGAITAEYGGMKNELGLKGVYMIKDGFVEVTSKDNSVKYKITNVKDGNIYCADRNMTHIMKIESETGKKKGFMYDRKITFTADKAMGGTTAEYWCKKE